MINLIDLMYFGCDWVIGAYEVDGVIVDPGFVLCFEVLLVGFEGELCVFFFIYIYLDHAGVLGLFVEWFLDLWVYVYEVGVLYFVDL